MPDIKKRSQREAFEAIKLWLRRAFALADSDYERLSVDDTRQHALAGTK